MQTVPLDPLTPLPACELATQLVRAAARLPQRQLTRRF